MNLTESRVIDGKFTIFYNDCLLSESITWMNEMRQEGNLCDVRLQVENQSFSVHKVVLGGASLYFRAMFTENMAEDGGIKDVALNDIEALALESLINYAYSGSIRIDLQNAQSLMVGALLLQLNKVKEACIEFLMSNFDANNVLGIRRWAESLDCKRLVKACDKYINSHFAVVSESDQFCLLNPEQVIELIERDELNVSTEEIIFEACIRWVKYNEDERREKFSEVFSNIRLPRLSPYFLVDRVCNEEVVKRSPGCMHLVDEAKNYHLLPERRGLLKDVRTHPRCLYFVIGQICLVGGRTSGSIARTVEIYNPQTKKWTSGAQMAIMGFVDGVVAFDGQLYVFGHNVTVGSTFLQKYDFQEDIWSEGDRMRSQQRWMTVAVLEDLIYLCGGYDEGAPVHTVNCFNPRTGEWTTAAPMIEGRSDASAASLVGYIYVLGGCTGNSISNSVECYDSVGNIWVKVKSMLNKRHRFSSATLNGKLYACGGHDGNSFLRSVEVYDPITDSWSLVASMNCKRSLFGLVANLGKLWAIGGYDCGTDLSSVEVYDPDTNEWTYAPPMNTSRSCMGVGIIPNP